MTPSTDGLQTSDVTGAVAQRSMVIGMILVLSSAVAWSTAGFFARMAPVDIWVVLFWRSVFGSLSIFGLGLNLAGEKDPEVHATSPSLRWNGEWSANLRQRCDNGVKLV
jgi:drug/metabolite transporter (DMT)-like permease